MKNLSSLKIYFFVLLLSAIPLILPFFHSGFFPTHDGEWAVVRLSDMFREFKDLQLPPRFSGYLNFEYGYPLFNFAYPFPYYIGVFIHLSHQSFVNSIKIIFAASVLLSATTMFFLSKKLWENSLAGFISAVLYIYLPYRMVDLYVRGSIGESIAFVFFPLILYFVLKIKEKHSYRSIAMASFFYAALIASHNIMAVYFTIILAVFLLVVSYHNRRFWVRYLIFLVLSLSVSSYFWIPALLEKKDILLSIIPIADRNLYYVSLPQIIVPSWGYGIPTKKDSFTYNIGIPQIILLFGVFLSLIISWYKKRKKARSFFMVSLSILCLGMIIGMFSFSSFIWKAPFLSEINYPWTLLAPIGFLTSLLAGSLVNGKNQNIVVGLFCLFAIALTLPNAHPKKYLDRGDPFYITNQATTTSANELLPLWVKKFPIKSPQNFVEIVSGKGTVGDLSLNSKKIAFTVSSEKQTDVRINRIYYPGWQIRVNGKNAAIRYSNLYGVMDITVPQGRSRVQADFTETLLRTLCDVASVIGFVILLVFLFFEKLPALYKGDKWKV